MIITDDNEKLRRSPSPISPLSPISTGSSSSTSSSPNSSRSSTASSFPSSEYRRSSYDSNNGNRWSSPDAGNRGPPTSHSSAGRRTSYSGSLHSRASPQYTPYSTDGRRNIPMNDDPPPYTPFDEGQYSYQSRPQPQTYTSYTFNHNGPRRPQTRHTAPPQSPPRRPSSSGGGPPASVQPTNGLLIERANDSIYGSYIIDPDKPGVGGNQNNLTLSSRNGSLDVDVAVLPKRSTIANNADRASIKCETNCGSVKFRLHEAPNRFLPNNGNGTDYIQRAVAADVKSKNGTVNVCIPRSFQGLLHVQTANGRLEFSPAVSATMTTLDSEANVGRNSEAYGFIGEYDGLRELMDRVTAERVANAADQNDGRNQNYNFRNFRSGPGVTRVTTTDGTTTYFSGGGNNGMPGGSGMFNGVSNVTITGGEFHNVGGQEYVTFNGQPVNQTRGPYQSASNFSVRFGVPIKFKEPSAVLQVFEADWKGSKINAGSKNGNVKVWFDDEMFDGNSGGWKPSNEDNGNRRNTVFITGGGFTNIAGITSMGRGFPFMNVGNGATFGWF